MQKQDGDGSNERWARTAGRGQHGSSSGPRSTARSYRESATGRHNEAGGGPGGPSQRAPWSAILTSQGADAPATGGQTRGRAATQASTRPSHSSSTTHRSHSHGGAQNPTSPNHPPRGRNPPPTYTQDLQLSHILEQALRARKVKAEHHSDESELTPSQQSRLHITRRLEQLRQRTGTATVETTQNKAGPATFTYRLGGVAWGGRRGSEVAGPSDVEVSGSDGSTDPSAHAAAAAVGRQQQGVKRRSKLTPLKKKILLERCSKALEKVQKARRTAESALQTVTIEVAKLQQQLDDLQKAINEVPNPTTQQEVELQVLSLALNEALKQQQAAQAAVETQQANWRQCCQDYAEMMKHRLNGSRGSAQGGTTTEGSEVTSGAQCVMRGHGSRHHMQFSDGELMSWQGVENASSSEGGGQGRRERGNDPRASKVSRRLGEERLGEEERTLTGYWHDVHGSKSASQGGASRGDAADANTRPHSGIKTSETVSGGGHVDADGDDDAASRVCASGNQVGLPSGEAGSTKGVHRRTATAVQVSNPAASGGGCEAPAVEWGDAPVGERGSSSGAAVSQAPTGHPATSAPSTTGTQAVSMRLHRRRILSELGLEDDGTISESSGVESDHPLPSFSRLPVSTSVSWGMPTPSTATPQAKVWTSLYPEPTPPGAVSQLGQGWLWPICSWEGDSSDGSEDSAADTSALKQWNDTVSSWVSNASWQRSIWAQPSGTSASSSGRKAPAGAGSGGAYSGMSGASSAARNTKELGSTLRLGDRPAGMQLKGRSSTLNSTNQMGSPNMAGARPGIMAAAGPGSMAAAGPGSIAGARPHSMTAAGPHSMTAAGPGSMAGARPHSMTAAGPGSMAAAGPSNMAAVRPGNVAAAGPRNMAAAGTDSTTAAGPSNILAAGPRNLAAAGPSNVAAAGPSNVAAAGPNNVAAAGPSNVAAVRPSNTLPVVQVPTGGQAAVTHTRQTLNTTDHGAVPIHSLTQTAVHGTGPDTQHPPTHSTIHSAEQRMGTRLAHSASHSTAPSMIASGVRPTAPNTPTRKVSLNAVTLSSFGVTPSNGFAGTGGDSHLGEASAVSSASSQLGSVTPRSAQAYGRPGLGGEGVARTPAANIAIAWGPSSSSNPVSALAMPTRTSSSHNTLHVHGLVGQTGRLLTLEEDDDDDSEDDSEEDESTVLHRWAGAAKTQINIFRAAGSREHITQPSSLTLAAASSSFQEPSPLHPPTAAHSLSEFLNQHFLTPAAASSSFQEPSPLHPSTTTQSFSHPGLSHTLLPHRQALTPAAASSSFQQPSQYPIITTQSSSHPGLGHAQFPNPTQAAAGTTQQQLPGSCTAKSNIHDIVLVPPPSARITPAMMANPQHGPLAGTPQVPLPHPSHTVPQPHTSHTVPLPHPSHTVPQPHTSHTVPLPHTSHAVPLPHTSHTVPLPHTSHTSTPLQQMRMIHAILTSPSHPVDTAEDTPARQLNSSHLPSGQLEAQQQTAPVRQVNGAHRSSWEQRGQQQTAQQQRAPGIQLNSSLGAPCQLDGRQHAAPGMRPVTSSNSRETPQNLMTATTIGTPQLQRSGAQGPAYRQLHIDVGQEAVSRSTSGDVSGDVSARAAGAHGTDNTGSSQVVSTQKSWTPTKAPYLGSVAEQLRLAGLTAAASSLRPPEKPVKALSKSDETNVVHSSAMSVDMHSPPGLLQTGSAFAGSFGLSTSQQQVSTQHVGVSTGVGAHASGGGGAHASGGGGAHGSPQASSHSITPHSGPNSQPYIAIQAARPTTNAPVSFQSPVLAGGLQGSPYGAGRPVASGQSVMGASLADSTLPLSGHPQEGWVSGLLASKTDSSSAGPHVNSERERLVTPELSSTLSSVLSSVSALKTLEHRRCATPDLSSTLRSGSALKNPECERLEASQLSLARNAPDVPTNLEGAGMGPSCPTHAHMTTSAPTNVGVYAQESHAATRSRVSSVASSTELTATTPAEPISSHTNGYPTPPRSSSACPAASAGRLSPSDADKASLFSTTSGHREREASVLSTISEHRERETSGLSTTPGHHEEDSYDRHVSDGAKGLTSASISPATSAQVPTVSTFANEAIPNELQRDGGTGADCAHDDVRDGAGKPVQDDNAAAPSAGPSVADGHPWRCEICNVTCNSKGGLDQHLASKRHLSKATRQAIQPVAQAAVLVQQLNDAGHAPATYVGPNARLPPYCHQLITSELNDLVSELLLQTRAFQERAFAKNAVKAQMRRWYVQGLREVAKSAKMRKAKCVILAPNIEHHGPEGALQDTVGGLLELCNTTGIPVVFALSRKKLGDIYCCRKRMSAVALLDTAGVPDLYERIMGVVRELQQQYQAQQIEAQTGEGSTA